MSGAGSNIAHVLPWASVGGTELATLRLARAAAGAGFKSHAFYLKGADAVRDLFEGAGIEAIPYEPPGASLRRAARFLADSRALSKEFARRDISLVHCADVLAGCHAGLAGRMAGLPVVCHVRNRYESLPRREAVLLRAVNKFVFVSRDTWRRFSFRVPPRRGQVIYDGIDVAPSAGDPAAAREAKRAVLAEYGLPEGTKLVGMVARVAPQKDYETLAKAAARVAASHPEARFIVVGDNSLADAHREHFAAVRRMLADAGVESAFVFTGFREDVPRMIDALDIFVLCTHLEGFPLVILEAMARAKPVVATAVDGIPEIVVEGTTGLLHPHRDDARLAAQLVSLLDSPARAAALAEAGREVVRANFSNEKFAADVARFYRANVRGGAGRPLAPEGTGAEVGGL